LKARPRESIGADTDNIDKTHANTDSRERQQIDASSVTAADLQQESNTNTETRTPEQEVEIAVAEVKQGLRGLFVKSEDFIKRLGNALKKVVTRERDICEEIKNALKEEITEGIISTRAIELHCPPEWRREWKRRTKSESEIFSLSKPQSVAVAKTEDGKSVTETGNASEPGSITAAPTSAQSIDTHKTGEDSMSPGSMNTAVCENCSNKDIRIKKLEDENRELGVRCSLEESSNSELVLQLTAREIEIEKLLEEEHDLSDLQDQYVRQECLSCRELKEKVIELSEALKHTSIRTSDEIPASEESWRYVRWLR
jgi:hypothetical protein